MKAFKSLWNLRTKSMVVIGLIIVAMIAVLFFAAETILFTSFARVEKTATERNVNRVADAISDEIQALSNYTSAYSVWDDTIDFIKRGEDRTFEQNATDEYVDSNITPATFESEGHNLFAFVTLKGKLVWGTGYDLKKSKLRPISDSLQRYFTGSSPLLKHKDEVDYKNGFVLVDEGLMYLSIQPQVDSNGEPPIEGTLATGRDFDDTRIKLVEDKTHLKIKVFLLNAADLPAEAVEAKTTLADGNSVFIKAANQNTIYGYTVLKDINGQPLLLLRVDVPREIYRQGLAARNYLVISLLVIGVIFLVMALVLLTRLYRRDQEIAELKDRFIAIASHELRTPLTSIKGGADLLAMEKLPAKSKPSLELIHEGIARLSHLTDELINVATIEKGQFKAVREPIDVGKLAADACSSFKRTAASKQLSLDCAVAPDLPALNADPRLLRSAIMNLLDNAIKFTDKGGVSLTVETRGNVMAIEVSDTGPGIKQETSYMLFQKFSKIASVRQSFKEGHGLGLYLTKLAAEAHEGRIEASSTGQGSVFTISIPLKFARPS